MSLPPSNAASLAEKRRNPGHLSAAGHGPGHSGHSAPGPGPEQQRLWLTWSAGGSSFFLSLLYGMKNKNKTGGAEI